nr:reverse transcriptase domain-containing protein [Tanacetum cinerariifolium]
MSSPNHHIYDIEDAFSSNSPNYTLALPDYSPASSGNTPSESSNNSYGLVPIASPTLSLFHDDPYFRNEAVNDPPPLLLPYLKHLRYEKALIRQVWNVTRNKFEEIMNHLDELYLDRIEHMEDKIEGLGNGRVIIQQDFDNLETELQEAQSSLPVRLIIPTPLGYSFDKSIFTKLDIIMNHIVTPRNELVLEKPNKNASQKDINICNTNHDSGCHQAIRAVVLIRWFERSESVFSCNNCAEENKVTFANSTLTDDALSWLNAYAQAIGIEQANKITWTELKRLLTNKYCPRNEVKKMEDKFYNLIVKGNDLKTYIRRFQKLAVLCPNMVPNTEKLMEVFIRGLLQSIKGIVTVSKPQTLEEAINIGQRLMDQIIKCGSMQGTSNHKRKFDDRRNSNNNNNNYPNNSRNTQQR